MSYARGRGSITLKALKYQHDVLTYVVLPWCRSLRAGMQEPEQKVSGETLVVFLSMYSMWASLSTVVDSAVDKCTDSKSL